MASSRSDWGLPFPEAGEGLCALSVSGRDAVTSPWGGGAPDRSDGP